MRQEISSATDQLELVDQTQRDASAKLLDEATTRLRDPLVFAEAFAQQFRRIDLDRDKDVHLEEINKFASRSNLKPEQIALAGLLQAQFSNLAGLDGHNRQVLNYDDLKKFLLSTHADICGRETSAGGSIARGAAGGALGGGLASSAMGGKFSDGAVDGAVVGSIVGLLAYGIENSIVNEFKSTRAHVASWKAFDVQACR